MSHKLKEFTTEKNYNRIEDLLSTLKELTNFVYEEVEFKGVDLNNYEDLLFNF
jgi:hypothetical protein